MSLTTLKTLGGETTIQPTAAKLRSYSGHQIPIHGCTTLLCEHKDKTYPMKFYIAEGDVLSVLSAQACKDLSLVQRVNSVIDSSVITDARPDILLEYPDLFHGLDVYQVNIPSELTQQSSQWYIHQERYRLH